MINYGTPKEVQQRLHRDAHSIPGKRKFICKKNKGEHIFELSSTTVFKWWPLEQGFQTRIYEYRCSACGKKRVDFVKEPLEENEGK